MPHRPRLRLLVAAALGALCHLVASPAIAENGRSRIYVFGGIVADLELGWERFATFSSGLSDCSTERFRCISGNIIKVSVPRQCSDLELDAYGSGEERTVLLHRLSNTSQATFFRERLIGNPARPYVVYGYTPQRGITFVVYDPTRRMNLVSSAESGELLGLVSRDPAYRNMRMDLITFSQLFPCEGQF